MLSEKSVPGPKFKDPLVRVKVLTAMRCAGQEYQPGDVLQMLSSDAAYAARSITPPQIEIL